jgi:hypothetical protein
MGQHEQKAVLLFSTTVPCFIALGSKEEWSFLLAIVSMILNRIFNGLQILGFSCQVTRAVMQFPGPRYLEINFD